VFPLINQIHQSQIQVCNDIKAKYGPTVGNCRLAVVGKFPLLSVQVYCSFTNSRLSQDVDVVFVRKTRSKNGKVPVTALYTSAFNLPHVVGRTKAFMSKPISRPMHGYTDYNYIATVSIAPELAGFEDEPAATALCRILPATIFASSFLTRSEWGILRVMPYKLHLLIDTLGGLTALSAPWVFGFSKNPRARNSFILIGIFGLIAGLLSQSDEME
jgi:hypothetical protein